MLGKLVLIAASLERNASALDNEQHQYVLDLSALSGTVTVILSGGSADPADTQFSNIFLY